MPSPYTGRGSSRRASECMSGMSFFRELPRPVVVGAAGDDNGVVVGLEEGPAEQVRRGLGRGIGRVGRQRRGLGEGGIVRGQGAVHLVRGDVHEALHPGRARRPEQVLGAKDVGGHEGGRVGDGAVHVGLGREVDHGVHSVFVEQGGHQIGVGDVAVHEDVAAVAGLGRGLFQGQQVGPVARVGQLVQVDHAPVGVVLPGPGR